MADHAHDAATLAQAVEHVHHLVEGVLVEGAEPLVDEQRLDAGAAGLGHDDVRQAESQGEAGQERLPARQRAGLPVVTGPAVAGQQAQPRTRPALGRPVGVHEGVATLRHAEQPHAGGRRDLLQPRSEDEGRQGHPQLVATGSAAQVGQGPGRRRLGQQRDQLGEGGKNAGCEVGEV